MWKYSKVHQKHKKDKETIKVFRCWDLRFRDLRVTQKNMFKPFDVFLGMNTKDQNPVARLGGSGLWPQLLQSLRRTAAEQEETQAI